MSNLPDLSGATWRKSTYSNNGECVEVAALDRLVGVRDSKDRGGAILFFTHGEWNAFLAGTRTGEFDLGQLDALTPS